MDWWFIDGIDIMFKTRILWVIYMFGYMCGYVVFYDVVNNVLFFGDYVLLYIMLLVGFELSKVEFLLWSFLDLLWLVKMFFDVCLFFVYGFVIDLMHVCVDELFVYYDEWLMLTAGAVVWGVFIGFEVVYILIWMCKYWYFDELDVFNQMMVV